MKTQIVSSVSNRPQDRLRDRIAEAARRRFFEFGFVRVTMDDLAADLGISKATLYKTVRGKEDILRTIVRSMLGAMDDRIQAIVNAPGLTTVAKLTRLFSVLSTELSHLKPAMARDLQKAAPGIWAEIEAFRRHKILTHFRSLLEAGKREGVIRPETDVDLVIRFFLVMIQNFLNPEEVARGDRSPSQMFGAIVQILFGGILTDSARRAFEQSGSPILIPRPEDL